MTENRKMLYTNDLDGFDKVSVEDFVVLCNMMAEWNIMILHILGVVACLIF